MSHRIRLIIAILSVTLLMTETAFSYWVWTPQAKKWVNPKYAPKDTPKEQLLYAMDFYEDGDYKKALREFTKIIRYYKRSEAASEAQYYIGRCHENLNDPLAAFRAYQGVIENYPFTDRVDEIIQRQFDIGENLYKGEKTKFLGLGFKALPEQVIEVYEKVISNAPYSKFAPQAQFRVGELYKKLEFYQEAQAAFQKILENYPDSAVAVEAKFQVALCASVGSGKSGYDQSLTQEAIKEFEEFATKYPDNELVKKARQEKQILFEKQANSYLTIARFYERLGKYESAAIYYNKIIDEFGELPMASTALERLKVIEKRFQRKK